LNPSIHPELDRDGRAWTAPLGLTSDQLAAVMKLLAALVTDDAVAMVKALGRSAAWCRTSQSDVVITSNVLLGNTPFSGGSEHWRTLQTPVHPA
jgi:hypothetical protein